MISCPDGTLFMESEVATGGEPGIRRRDIKTGDAVTGGDKRQVIML